MSATVESLVGRSVLVVEDDYLIADVLSEMLSQAGLVVFGPVASVADALAIIQREGQVLDGALLDVTLRGGETSYPIADVLEARGVRLVFTSGYDSGTLAEAYRFYPRCRKPFTKRALLAVLDAALN